MENRAFQAEQQMEILVKENAELKAKLCGDRVCDGYCENCKHGLGTQSYHPVFGNYISWKCELDCKCKDFERKPEQ